MLSRGASGREKETHRAPTMLTPNCTALSCACEVVIAAHDALHEVGPAAQLAANAGCNRVNVYTKSASCSSVMDDPAVVAANASGAAVGCVDLPNVGREQHTFAHHVASQFDRLANHIIFLPLPMNATAHVSGIRHEVRKSVYAQALRAHASPSGAELDGEYALSRGFYTCHGFGGVPGTSSEADTERLEGFLGWKMTMDDEGRALTPAQPSPLGAWAQAHLGISAAALARIPVCYEGAAATSLSYVQARGLASFQAIEAQLAVGGGMPEAGHYMERLMLAAYGPPILADPSAASGNAVLHVGLIVGGVLLGLVALALGGWYMAAHRACVWGAQAQAKGTERSSLMASRS